MAHASWIQFQLRNPSRCQSGRIWEHQDYGGTITTADGIAIVMEHREQTWRMPRPETCLKGFGSLPCNPNNIFLSHYSADSFASLNCLDPQKACP